MGSIELEENCCIEKNEDFEREEKDIPNNCNDAETLNPHKCKQPKAHRTVKLQKIHLEVF